VPVIKQLSLLVVVLAGAPLALAQAPAPLADAYLVLERGRVALLAEKYVEAGEALDSLLHSREFAGLDASLQFRTFLFSALAASGRDDYLSAHEYMLAATQFPEADAEQWMLRARYALYVDALPDAALALTTTARRWPEALMEDDDQKEFVGTIAFRLRRDAARHADYLQLADALFAAKFKREFDAEPDGLWSDLILGALEHGDTKRARELAGRVENTDTLLAMRIDKRFDPVVRADPKRFDLSAAMKRHTKKLARQMADQPRRLAVFVQYLYALMDEGRYAEVLADSDAALKKVAKGTAQAPAHDDLDQSLNWVYNHKAAALRALGRWNEALAAMDAGSHLVERGSDNVSQAINLGSNLNDAGQPQKALDALAAVDWSRGLSPYGRMQLECVRYIAYLQLGNRSEAEKVLAYLREHHDDANDTWQYAMLESGDEDGAAAALIAQLRDTETRGSALATVQDYPPHIRSARMRESHDRWAHLVARADVTAAINEVGRIEKVPVYQLSD
jgi:hypothetical protein